MKKRIYGALALGAALALGLAAGGKAEAAETTNITDIAFDGTDTLTITKNSTASKVLVGVPSFKSYKNASGTVPGKKMISISTWDVYEPTGDEVKVDLSKYAKTKDTYLAVKADFDTDSEVKIVKIPISDKLKASYDKKTAKITFKIAAAGAKTYVDYTLNGTPSAQTLYFYTPSHSEGTIEPSSSATAPWVVSGAGITAETYQMSGATLYVEKRGVSQSIATPTVNPVTAYTSGNFKVGSDVIVLPDEANTPATAYEFKARSSAAVKLNITKLAAAPKVKVDYAKGTITLAAGVRADFVSQDPTNDKSGYGSTSKTVLTVSTAATTASNLNASTGCALDVYKDAVSNTSLKSRTVRYVYKAQETTTSSALSVTIKHKGGGKYKATVTSTDPTFKYLITYKDNKRDDKTATTTVSKGADKPGTATLDNINAEDADLKLVKIKRLGNAATGDWVAKEVTWDISSTTGGVTINRDGDTGYAYKIGVEAGAATDTSDINKINAAVTTIQAALDAMTDNSATPNAFKKNADVKITFDDSVNNTIDPSNVKLSLKDYSSTTISVVTGASASISFKMPDAKNINIVVNKAN